MRLFHGSTSKVLRPSIHKCRDNTDFGKGFYTTTSLEQAQKWARLKKERSAASEAIVTVFEITNYILVDTGFSVLNFDGATRYWLDFVLANRRGEKTDHYYMVMGPVANDKLYATLTLYEEGILTADAAIEQLKSHTLFDQLSFHTPKAIEQLTFIEAHVVSD